MKTRTFCGLYVRVQLGTLDLSPPVKFFVYGISAQHDKSTAFRGKAGKQLYFGDDFAAAWAQVVRHVPDAVVPSWAKRFIKEPAAAESR